MQATISCSKTFVLEIITSSIVKEYFVRKLVDLEFVLRYFYQITVGHKLTTCHLYGSEKNKVKSEKLTGTEIIFEDKVRASAITILSN